MFYCSVCQCFDLCSASMSGDVPSDGEVLMDVTNSYEIVQGVSHAFSLLLNNIPQ